MPISNWSASRVRPAVTHTSEIDVYRTAQLLVRQHGEDAPQHAAQRADQLLTTGDFEGEAVWLRVLRAIRVILSGRDVETLQ